MTNKPVSSYLLTTKTKKNRPRLPDSQVQNKPESERHEVNTVWNIFILFPNRKEEKGPEKKPSSPKKDWMEILLMLLKVGAALMALIKAIGWLS